ncbi:hypothetical protein H109_03712 [Trichophyton interdigitale MR816]|uniref:DUF924 domain-containing protein n=1 Tax=Trichophyton interdigitale (strain MR816) TaxID=1215338 RepID=A0A059J9Q5_TRIIM|nr:hypothetical protein H101_01788 [Trichophyton interdigitale H6]KDB24423.1 hypothetical protein H109_03712 [Trichophyton interdigitale MR816]
MPIMNADVKRIITFWFNRPPVEWISAPRGIDDQIRSEFSDLVIKARQNRLDDWEMEPEACLALVVLLDQFSRNLFRGSPDAFGADSKAHEIATRAIIRGFDKDVTVIQASAFYLPLLHQESLISLVAARSLFENLRQRCVASEEKEWADMGVDIVNENIQYMEKFGRYPSRNVALGRANTEAEEEYLKKRANQE